MAGHQNRVSDLACALAAEMGLTDSQIKGIDMEASVHDIGKISIPVDILSRPTRLTDVVDACLKIFRTNNYKIEK